MYLKQCMVASRVEFFKGDIQEIIKSHKTIKQWAYMLHDKDDTAPHYHIYLNFGSSGVDTKQIGDWFGLQESQVEKIKGRKTDALEYLTHSNDTQKYKYQYSPTEVIANFDVGTEITNSKILGDFKNFSYAQQLEYVDSLPKGEKTAAYSKLKKLWEIHCQMLALNPDRQIDVVFIQGKGGAGKTYYAKKLCRSMEKDFYVSSSSNDPFQDYLGQKVIILDDLRDDVFSFADLLKILDNNTASSMKSRFSNKVFNGDMIIITTEVPLCLWFKDMQYYPRGQESLYQLYRRISSYVKVSKTEIQVYSELDARGNPCGTFQAFKNELSDPKREKKQKTDFGSIFGTFCAATFPEELM